MNATDFTGQTALHWTAVRGSIQVAELLLQNGARVECADSHGYRVCNPNPPSSSLWFLNFFGHT